MLRPFLGGARPEILLWVETSLWLPAFGNRAGGGHLFHKDPANHDLKLLFRRQREKRDAETENEMPSKRIGNQIVYFNLTQNRPGVQAC